MKVNGYDAVRRLVNISDELTTLSHELGASVKPTARALIEKKINALEDEFFRLKHSLEKMQMPVQTAF